MATNFDSLVDQVTTDEPAPPPVPVSAPQDPFDSLVDQVIADDNAELHGSLFGAVDANPAEEANRRKQAKQLGVSPLLVTDDAPAQIRQKALNAEAIAAETPGTAKFLTNPDNARLAADSVLGLQSFEKLLKNGPRILSRISPQFAGVGDALDFALTGKNPWKRGDDRTVGQIVTDPLKAAAGGVNLMAASIAEGARYIPSEIITNKALEVFMPEVAKARRDLTAEGQAIFNRGAEFWQQEKSPQMQRSVEAFNKADLADALVMLVNDPGLMMDQLSQSAPYIVPGAAVARGGVAATLAYNSTIEALDAANSARQEAIRQGRTTAEQDVSAAMAAVVTAPLAFLGNKLAGTGLLESEFFTKGRTGFSLVQTALREMVSGAFEEGGNQLGVNLGAGTYDPTREAFAGVGKAAALGGFLESVHGVGMSTAEFTLRTLSRGAETAKQARYQNFQAALQAENAFNTLTALSEKAASDSLRGLDEDAFHEFITTMAEDAETMQEVFVDAKTLNEALTANNVSLAEVTAKMPDVAKQLAEGLAAGGDVRISLPDFLTYLAPNPAGKALLPSLRVSADGLTYSESQAFYQTQVEEDKVIAEKLALESEPVMSREEFEAAQVVNLANDVAPELSEITQELGTEATEAISASIVADQDTADAITEIAAAVAPQTYEQYLAEHPNKKAVRAREITAVHDAILSGLNETGRFPRQVNAAYAVPFREFYVQNAERMGISPTELYNRIPLRFVAESMGLNAAFSQPEQLAGLQDFAPGEVQDILSKHNWTILTAENPKDTYTPEQNDALMEELRTYLDVNRIAYQDVEGFYNRPERSVVLFGVTARQALDIGRLFDQDSVLTRDGFVYQDGSVQPTLGTVTEFESAEQAENFYSVIPALGTVFRVEIDWDAPRLLQGEHRGFEQAITQTETPEFKKWFGDWQDPKAFSSRRDPDKSPVSVAIDENGAPEIFYHTTLRDFSAFEIGRKAINSGTFGSWETTRAAVFFTNDPEASQAYGRRAGEFAADARVMPVYLNVKQVLDLSGGFVSQNIADEFDSIGFNSRWLHRFDWSKFDDEDGREFVDAARRLGYDAVLFNDENPDTGESFKAWAVFEPTQIKSAIGNVGTFDPQNPNILYQEGGKLGQISITGVHFSREQRQTIDGRYYGRGIRGAERDRVDAAKDWRLKHRIHFYVDEGKGVFPEGGVGQAKHVMQLDNMYDGARNPQKFQKRNADGEVDFNVFESAVLDAGFDGYYIEAGFGRQGVAVMLGEATHGLHVGGQAFAQTISGFDQWAGGLPVVEAEGRADFRAGEGVVVRALHGTTGDFEIFDRARANPESDFGAGFYFTNTPEDAAANYAGLGPDLMNKVQLLAERIAGETDRDYDDPEVVAEAHDQFMANEGLSMPVFVRFENPVVVGGQNETVFDYEITFDEEEDISDEQGLLVDFVMALRDIAGEYDGGSVENVIGTLVEEVQDSDEIGAERLVEILKSDEEFGYFTDDAGALVSTEITRQALEAIGFDGVIDQTVDKKFGSQKRVGAPMAGMAPDTVHFIAFEPTQIKSAIGNIGTFDPRNPNILYQSTQSWYFSQLARTIREAKQNTMPAAQWKAWLTGNAAKFGIKKDEIQWTGITEWLDLQDGKVSRDDILAFLDTNGVRVDDVFIASEETAPGIVVAEDYAAYTVPGGENYKVLMLTLPVKDGRTAEQREFYELSQEMERDGLGGVELERIYELAAILGPEGRTTAVPNMEGAYKSSHFDVRNILAHVRFDERVDAEGAKTLFIHEIQSDWGQEGKKKGFISRPSLEPTEDGTWLVRTASGRRFGEYSNKPDAEAAMGRASTLEGGTPLAPFVTDTKAWVALAIKRMIAYAAENDFKKIAFITGEQAANLYDLSKQVDTVTWYENRGVYDLDIDGRNIATDVPPSLLEDYVGKELAERIVRETETKDRATYSGLDLRVGGEGMKAFYDQIVPQVANDVLKKLGGGKMEPVAIAVPGVYELRADNGQTLQFNTEEAAESWLDEHDETGEITFIDSEQGRRDDALLADLGVEVKGARPPTQLGITISDEMWGKVLNGLPLFQQALGSFDPNSLTISMLNGANLSTVLHEGGHFYLRALELMSAMPEATPEMKADFDKTMAWFGTTREQWAAMSVDEQRPYHEQWAQSQERWMLEGKSPTMEMQPIFARFRAWMLDIYKSVEAFLLKNPLAGKLNDEIRGVFSRLIASEKAIEQAELARGYSLLFKTEEEAKAQGISGAEYRDYLKQFKDAHQDGVDALQQRSLRDMKWVAKARSKAIRDLQKQAAGMRADMRAEVTVEVMAEPINQARTFLRTGEMTDPETGDVIKAAEGYRLDADAVRAMYPETALGNPDLTKLKGMTTKNGLDPELLARMFGFDSGDKLIRELIDGEDPQQKIEGLTEQRMLEMHGEMIDQRAIEAAADEVVHNEARARFMATGLRMLTKSPISSYQLAKAAKEAAERTVAGKKVRDLRPNQHTAAETRANKEALTKAPIDPAGAVEAQRVALLNNRMAKVSMDVLEEIKGLLKYVSKFRNEGTRKSIDLEYLEQIDQLLAAFDASPATTLKDIAARQSLAAWVAEQEALGYEPTLDAETLAEMKRVSYKDMTVEQLRGFVDGIKEIEHFGRMKKKLLTALDRRAFQERMAEADASIRENANRVVPERATPQDVVGQLAKFGRWWAANHRKFSSFLREMDGGQDDGAMWNLLARSMNDAGTRETRMRAEANEALAAIFKPIQEAMSRNVLPGALYARKTVVPGTDLSMTLEQRIMFAMNWGNEGNRQRLLDGGISGRRALSGQQAKAILDTLTKEQWDFVQSVWDYIGTYRPLIEEQERLLTGKTPAWVEPAPVATQFGVYPGGYFPAKYDAQLSTRSESLEAATNLRMGMKGAFNAAAARNGYTKERSAQVINRPLLLSFNTISQHVNEVIHRVSWQPWLVDANRTLRALDGVIREHYGVEVLTELRNTVRDIAQGDAPAITPTEVAINRVRVGSTIVGMGYNFATALLQPTGLAQSWSRVGGRWIARGLKEYLGAPISSTEDVLAKSDFMRHRGQTMNREINEVLNTIRGGEKLSAVKASFFTMIGKMQQVVDIPTWLGAYEKGLEQLKYEAAASEEQREAIEKHAIALADQAVKDAQSHGETMDLAGVQRGGPAQKLWTNFYSYFSATYNLNVEAFRRTDFKNPSDIAAFAADMVILNIVPVLFSVALHQVTKGRCEWDDTECLVGEYGQEQLSYLFGQMILLREIGVAVGVATGGPDYGYSGPAGIRFFGDMVKAGQQLGQGEVDMALFKALNSVTGAVLHYPAGQINRTMEGIIAVENGDVEGVAILPALLFGPPRG